jgi:superoxide dismutase, Fe-Mn family
MPLYTLADCPYNSGALQPHISGRTRKPHHNGHASAYVKGRNETRDELAEARRRDDLASIARLEKFGAFHSSGHVPHSLFRRNDPRPGGYVVAAWLLGSLVDLLLAALALARSAEANAKAHARLRT